MTGWSEIAFAWANALSDRSFTLDALLALMVDNPVAKAGPIVAAFAFAWWAAAMPEAKARRRQILLVTLLSVFLIAPIMKAVSTDGFHPRPLVRAEQVYSLEPDGALRPLARSAYRPPATGDAQVRHDNLARGDIAANDFSSFPSDHAALFLALAFGIFLAHRWAGAVALGWAVFGTLGSRVITGLHWPADIVAGGAIGIGFLLALQALASRLPRRWSSLPVAATERWPGLASAAIFLALFEVANAMNTLERLSELAASIAGMELG